MHLSILAILLMSYLLRAGAFTQHSGESYPTFPPPSGGKDIWQLGYKKNWPELRQRLAPFMNGGFYVTDEKSEKHLASIRKRLEVCNLGSTTCPTLLDSLIDDQGGDDEQLIHQVLSMGVDPDIPKGGYYWRPSHTTGYLARVAAAKALALCRVDQTALNPNRRTPVDAASVIYNEEQMASKGFNETELRKIRPIVHQIWLNAAKNPPPSVAEMASKKQWYAVQNLCRRRVISATEASGEFNGKTAYEWAVHHQEYGMAAELSYYLLNPGSETAHLKKVLVNNVKEIKNYLDSSLEGLWSKLQKLIEEKLEAKATFVQPGANSESQLDDNSTRDLN